MSQAVLQRNVEHDRKLDRRTTLPTLEIDILETPYCHSFYINDSKTNGTHKQIHVKTKIMKFYIFCAIVYIIMLQKVIIFPLSSWNPGCFGTTHGYGIKLLLKLHEKLAYHPRNVCEI